MGCDVARALESAPPALFVTGWYEIVAVLHKIVVRPKSDASSDIHVPELLYLSHSL